MNKTLKIIISVILSLLMLAIGALVGAFVNIFIINKPKSDNFTSGELSIHFLELGNNYTGDCIYIKAGDNDILVDGGSRTNSSSTIQAYVDQYVEDNTIEYAIITHADQDHIASWAGDNKNQSLFEMYTVKTIIDFPMTNKSTATYERYVTNRENEVSEGAKHFTALECYNNKNGGQSVYNLTEEINLQILYNYYYENHSSSENDYSVCFMINQGSNHYLFTGDLEEKGEKMLVEHNDLPTVTLFKAGHHGSATSNTDELLKVIKPKYVAITCVAGSVEYSTNINNTFPYQSVINTLAKYTTNVFVTSCMDMRRTSQKDKNDNYIYENVGDRKSLCGNIVFTFSGNSEKIECSNSNLPLKDSEWFKTYRTCPLQWQ